MMNNMYDILNKMNLLEGKSFKPDFPDIDRDGDRREPIKQAAKQARMGEADSMITKAAKTVGSVAGDIATAPMAATGAYLSKMEEKATGDYSAKKARAGKDIGRPGKQFAKIAKSAGERYGSKERGEKVAGAVLAKLRAKEDVNEADVEEGNDFTKARLDAIKAGKPTFRLNGKVYRVTGDTSDERMSEAKSAAVFPGTDEYKRRYGSDVEAFRLRHAPSVMRDPEARKGLAKMDAEHEKLKKMRRGEIDPDELGDEPPAGEKRGRGRPKGSKRAIGAKGPTGKSKLLKGKSIREGDNDIRDDLAYEIEQILDGAIAGTDQTDHIIDELGDLYDRIESSGDKVALKAYSMMNGSIDQGTHAQVRAAQMALKRLKSDIKEDYDKDEYDEEGEMAKSQARTIEDAAQELQDILDDDENLPEWVQKKIVLAKEYIDSARDYMKANPDEEEVDVDVEVDDEELVAEKAVSKAQRAAAGIAYAAKKGDIPKSELRGASKEMADMPSKELKKFAKTKEKDLPEKVKETDKKEVDETTTSGSVATSTEAPKAKKGGMQFGKGVYESQIAESFDRKLAMLTEGMTINASIGEDGQKSLSVSATDEEADQLAAILKMAGLGGAAKSQTCEVCGGHEGMHETGCASRDMVEEELANSPYEEYADTDTMVNKLSGGLNRQKTSGQTTLPVIDLNRVRQGVSEEKRLFDLYKQFKG